MGIKIKIECDDVVLSAAIGAAITRAFEAEQFTNVKTKMLLVYQDITGDEALFGRLSTLNELAGDKIKHRRPPLCAVELVPGKPEYLDTVPPSMLSRAIARYPTLLGVPILIDLSMPIPDDLDMSMYQKQEDAFLNPPQSK